MSDGATTPPKGRPTPKRPPNAPTAPPTTLPDQTGEATAASSWRSARKEGILVPLPSGQKARLKRTFNMLNALEHGELPNPLAQHIKAAIDDAGGTKDGALNLEILKGDEGEGSQSFVQFMQLVISSMTDIFVSPRVYQVPEGKDARTWNPADDPEVNDQEGLSVVDIDLQDQLFAFSFAQGGASDLAQFRSEPS